VTGSPTLRGRLALVAAAAIAIWVMVLTAGFNAVLASQLHAQAGTLLRERAAAAGATVELDRAGRVLIREVADDEAIDANVWIYDSAVALERPRASAPLNAAADRLARRGSGFAESGSTRLLAVPVTLQGRRVATVVTAVRLDPYRNALRLARAASVGLALLLLAGVYAVSRVLVGRALAPVQEMSQQAAAWGAAGATDRFGTSKRPAELATLAGNLDGVLDRVGSLLRHEQQVTEELSHELRTPLALIAAETELLGSRRRTPAEREAARARIAAAVERMTEILETLLTTARARSLAGLGRCDVLHVCARAALNVNAGGKQVDVTGAQQAAGVDARILDRILAPLLDNAVRYAASCVTIQVARVAERVVVRVLDDGPGLPSDLGDAVFEPGRRGAADNDHQGAGLGLALARRLARSAGGDLVIAVDGGLELQLPAAGSS
jgi:signal transduction histidine kinase